MKFLLPKNRMTFADFIIILSCIIIPLAVLATSLFHGASREIEVFADGEKTVYSLEKDGVYDITSGGYSYTLEIRDKNAVITEAGCPDKTCKKMGAIGKKNGSIVCVPGSLVIRTNSSGGGTDADIVIP